MQVLHLPSATYAASQARFQQACQQLSSSIRLRYFASKDASAAGSETATPDTAGSTAEQQTGPDDQAVDPKDQLIAEKEQQV